MVVNLVAFVAGRKVVTILRRVIPAIKETITEPGDTSHLQPLEVIFQYLAGLDFQYVTFLPIGAAAGQVIGKVASIPGSFSCCQAYCAVRGELIGVDQNAWGAFQALLHVENALILQPVVFRPQVVGTAAPRNAVLGVVVELLQPLLELSAIGDLHQVILSQLILRFDPGQGVGGVVILQPAIGIGYAGPVVVIDLLVAACFGIVHFSSDQVCENRRSLHSAPSELRSG